MVGLHPPRVDAPVDLDEHLALLPDGATCKGLFFADVIDKSKEAGKEGLLFERAGVSPTRFRLFHDYPYADYLRLVHAGAQLLQSTATVGEGLRRIGRSQYEALARTHIGRVLFGVLGRDFARIAKAGSKAYALSIGFGQVSYERLADKRGRYVFRDAPVFVETLQVGVVEGGLEATGTRGEVQVEMHSLGHGVIEFTWE